MEPNEKKSRKKAQYYVVSETVLQPLTKGAPCESTAAALKSITSGGSFAIIAVTARVKAEVPQVQPKVRVTVQ